MSSNYNYSKSFKVESLAEKYKLSNSLIPELYSKISLKWIS